VDSRTESLKCILIIHTSLDHYMQKNKWDLFYRLTRKLHISLLLNSLNYYTVVDWIFVEQFRNSTSRHKDKSQKTVLIRFVIVLLIMIKFCIDKLYYKIALNTCLQLSTKIFRLTLITRKQAKSKLIKQVIS